MADPALHPAGTPRSATDHRSLLPQPGSQGHQRHAPGRGLHLFAVLMRAEGRGAPHHPWQPRYACSTPAPRHNWCGAWRPCPPRSPPLAGWLYPSEFIQSGGMQRIVARYSEGRKEAVLSKLLPPYSMTVAELARQEGISEPTLYTWRNKAKSEGRPVPGRKATSEQWS